MATRMSNHQPACMCPACRAARGEQWRTKKPFTASINMELLANLRNAARKRSISLTRALEDAIRLYLEKVEQVEKMRAIGRIIQEEPKMKGIREFTDEEIKEWEEADKIDPELKAKIEAKRKALRKAACKK